MTKTDPSPRRLLRVTVSALAILLAMSLLTILPGGAEAAHRVPYQFAFHSFAGGGGTDVLTQVYIVRNAKLPLKSELTFTGWCCTDQGIDHYEYAWASTNGGPVEWLVPDKQAISAAPELAQAGIPYPGGYASAGFSLAFGAPEGTADGYYDVYIRAVTDDNVACDLAVLLNLAYGEPDTDTTATRTVNLDRLRRDISVHSGVTPAVDTGLVMFPDGMILLGDLPLSAFDAVTVTYTVPDSFTDADGDRRAILGLKAGTSTLYAQTDGKVPPYRMADGRYDMTGSLAYAPLSASKGTQTVRIDLTDVAYDGSVWLTAYLPAGNRAGLTVTSVVFSYKDYGYTRSAAKIHFTADLASYFYAPQHLALSTVHDAVMGDVMRLEVTTETDDPFIHFSVENLLNESGIRLSADEYKYMVILARANPANQRNHMSFYLCAGGIAGATEACNRGLGLINDGLWHYYVMDLQDPAWNGTPNWNGTIHMWRFDIVNGPCLPGDYVDYATVQFFRTEEAAREAASASVTRVDSPHRAGDPENYPPVEDDQSEEKKLGGELIPYTVPEKDIFIQPEPVTETPTEPAVEPITQPETSPTETKPQDTSDTSATEPPESEAAPVGKGCRSSLPSLPLLLLLLPLFLISARRTRFPTRRRR